MFIYDNYKFLSYNVIWDLVVFVKLNKKVDFFKGWYLGKFLLRVFCDGVLKYFYLIFGVILKVLIDFFNVRLLLLIMMVMILFVLKRWLWVI